MILSKSLPTIFAKAMAMSYDLYIVDKFERQDEWEDLHDRLVIFQQLATSNDFEICLTAYWGVKLDDDKKKILKLIYDTTRPWLMGHVIGELLEKLQSDERKDTSEIAQLILDNFVKSGKIDETTKKGLLVRFANIPQDEVKLAKTTGEEDE